MLRATLVVSVASTVLANTAICAARVMSVSVRRKDSNAFRSVALWLVGEILRRSGGGGRVDCVGRAAVVPLCARLSQLRLLSRMRVGRPCLLLRV